MNKSKVMKQARTHVTASRGLSMEETIALSMLPRINTKKSVLDETTLVAQAKATIENHLNRTNITAKDMRNAVVGLLRW